MNPRHAAALLFVVAMFIGAIVLWSREFITTPQAIAMAFLGVFASPAVAGIRIVRQR